MEDALFLFRSIYISYTMPTAVAFFPPVLSGCAYITQVGVYIPPERGSTSIPSGAVPLSRARQYLCPERGLLPHLERGVVPHPERGVPVHPERGVPVHPERGLLLHPARDLSPAAAPQNRFTVRASFHASFADSKTLSERQIHSICQITFLPFAIDRKRFCRKSNFAAAFKRV